MAIDKNALDSVAVIATVSTFSLPLLLGNAQRRRDDALRRSAEIDAQIEEEILSAERKPTEWAHHGLPLELIRRQQTDLARAARFMTDVPMLIIAGLAVMSAVVLWFLALRNGDVPLDDVGAVEWRAVTVAAVVPLVVTLVVSLTAWSQRREVRSREVETIGWALSRAEADLASAKALAIAARVATALAERDKAKKALDAAATHSDAANAAACEAATALDDAAGHGLDALWRSSGRLGVAWEILADACWEQSYLRDRQIESDETDRKWFANVGGREVVVSSAELRSFLLRAQFLAGDRRSVDAALAAVVDFFGSAEVDDLEVEGDRSAADWWLAALTVDDLDKPEGVARQFLEDSLSVRSVIEDFWMVPRVPVLHDAVKTLTPGDHRFRPAFGSLMYLALGNPPHDGAAPNSTVSDDKLAALLRATLDKAAKAAKGECERTRLEMWLVLDDLLVEGRATQWLHYRQTLAAIVERAGSITEFASTDEHRASTFEKRATELQNLVTA